MPIQSYQGKTLGGRLDPPPLGIRRVKIFSLDLVKHWDYGVEFGDI